MLLAVGGFALGLAACWLLVWTDSSTGDFIPWFWGWFFFRLVIITIGVIAAIVLRRRGRRLESWCCAGFTVGFFVMLFLQLYVLSLAA